MFDLLREDFQPYRHACQGQRLAGVRACLSYGFLAVCVYRFGRWTRRAGVLRWPLRAIHVVLTVFVELLLGIDISGNSDIGPGLFIGHFGGVFVYGNAGKNLRVGQGVTIGAKGAGKSNGFPQIGDDVYVGVGAMIIGNVHIGDGVVIGANTVVTKDVPPRTRVVSAPVRMEPILDPQTGPWMGPD